LHQRRYRRGEVEAKARAAGFQVLASTSFNMTLLPLAVLSRLAGKRKTQDGAISYARELKPPAIVNRAFAALLNAEVAATLAGCRWPLGTSRVVALKRR